MGAVIEPYAKDANGTPVDVLSVVGGHSIAYSGASSAATQICKDGSAANVITSGEKWVCVITSTTDCWVKQGSSTAAVAKTSTGTGALIKAGIPYSILVEYGYDYIAILRDASDGTLNVAIMGRLGA